ncbi:ketopantoate reductase family protein [Nocardia nova]|uniref:ketopantoate reductase family protein n=1 Tax=Nocardia nova TaxID=37330 RepID=UPI00340C05B9
MTRYVIVGAGAVGTTLAVELSGSGRDVLLVARGDALEYFRQHPVDYHTPAGVRAVRLPVAGEDVGLHTGDILVLTAKTQDVGAAAAAFAWHDVRDPDGVVVGVAAEHIPVVTVQNGLAAEPTAARWFATVVGAVLLVSARYERLGEIHVGASPFVGALIAGVAAGAPADGAAALTTLVDDLGKANFRTEAVSDIRAHKAAKILHSVKNGLEVLAGDPAGKAAVGAALVAETRRVLTAAGIAFREPESLLPAPARRRALHGAAPAGRQSTWQSFARGATTNEVDYLNGEIALLARLHGVDAPFNTGLQRLLGRATRNGGGLDLPGLAALTDLLPTVGDTDG